MAPRRLSDSDKAALVEQYKQPGQTTSTLAEQYGVSNSTVSRILKLHIPKDEYQALVAQKRTGGGDGAAANAKKRRSRSAADKKSVAKAEVAKEVVSAQTDEQPNPEPDEESPKRRTVAPPKLKTAEEKAESSQSSRRRRRRRSAADESGAADEAVAEDEQLPLLVAEDESADAQVEEDLDDDEDDLDGLDETLGDDFGDDDDDLDEEDELDDDDDEDDEAPKPKLQVDTMRVMPLGEAVLPKPCYLVVDTRAELITRPLIEFADLGQVPEEEERAKTLPVFDNHRVARRFSRNKQRVIKVPDGDLIMRTSPYLAAKGITRLLVDGQVFDLG